MKRTIYFGNPAYLSTRDEQLVISYPEPSSMHKTLPIEDLGLIVIDHVQITMTSALVVKLVEQNVAIVHCDHKHLPISLAQPLVGHSAQMERIRKQMDMSQPLKKQLWKQVVIQKIDNQAALLHGLGEDATVLYRCATHVTSGDASNQEAIAAAYYWQHLFDDEPDFTRDRYGAPPNHYLNFGYAILRALVARSIIGTGLLPSLGIFHHNKYNAYCLADDLMEPYRVYVDQLVLELLDLGFLDDDLPKEVKAELLQLPYVDVSLNKKMRPLQHAVERTCKSFYQCITGERRSLQLPNYEPITEPQ